MYMKNLSSTEVFIYKANIVHANKYDYSETEYTKSANKVIIICPDHGRFEQRAGHHLKGSGCKECGKIKAANKHRKTTEVFIEEAMKIHGNKYEYQKTFYERSNKKVVITCPEHGEFEQSPGGHLSGNGCTTCAIKNTPQMNIKSNDEFIKGCLARHDNFYSYEQTKYTGVNNKVIVTCPVHGEFTQLATAHLRGCGCPKCMKTGFNINKPAILYYLKITTEDNQVLYKIGITNRTVEERFSLIDLKKIEIIKQKTYKYGQEALDKENEIKRVFKEYIYKGPKVLDSGNTELFVKDIRQCKIK